MSIAQRNETLFSKIIGIYARFQEQNQSINCYRKGLLKVCLYVDTHTYNAHVYFVQGLICVICLPIDVCVIPLLYLLTEQMF